MFYKILDKYSSLKTEHHLQQSEENKNILNVDEEIMKKFMDLYDKDVKIIHTNQELIERDLQILYKETEKMSSTTKQAVLLYDNFLENMKEAGDLFNWCNILEKEMSEIHSAIASKHKGHTENIPTESLDSGENVEHNKENILQYEK
jgi:hypothetical protein